MESRISQDRQAKRRIERLQPPPLSSLDKEIFEIDLKVDELIQSMDEATQAFIQSLDEAVETVTHAADNHDIVIVTLIRTPRSWWRRLLDR